MTREIAINRIREIERCTPIHTEDDVKDCKALEMAIQALSQEPTVTSTDEPMTMVYPTIVCDDAISREAVYSILKEYHIDEEEIGSAMDECQNLTVNGITSDVSLLPSVTQKLGKWIGIDEEPHEDYECSCCGYVVSTFTANIEPHTEYKYCPNCGAKMESEDKE